MAEIKGNLGFADPSKLNQYGAKEEDISEYQQSLQDSINALQMRYAQPNWFNVAAGFFKPQLGGFAASLGSASEALGQNVEKQRESQLPIAQMRSQLALSKITMGQNKQAADLVKEWEGRKSPPGEMAALAQKLESLGATGLAAGIKGKLDTMRSTTASDQQALAIFYQKKASDIAAVQTQVQAKLIPKELASKLIDEITKRQPPSTTSFSLLPEDGAAAEVAGTAKAPGGMEKAPVSATDAAAADAVAAAAAAAAPVAKTAADAAAAKTAVAEPVAAPAKPKTLIKPVIDLNVETNDTESQIAARAARAAASGKEGDEVYSYLRDVGGPEAYNDNITPVKNALGLLGYGEKDLAKRKALEANANKVLNVLAGDTFSAMLAALNKGIGINIGPASATLSAPMETFVRARFPKSTGLQDYALDLAQNFAKINLVQQRMMGVNQSTARNAELHLYNASGPTMNSSPVAAMKNIMHLHTSIDQLRDMYNFVTDVDTGKHPEYEVAPGNDSTRIFDIVRSDGYKKISADYLKTHKAIEDARKK
jgi:hypothetical protein